MTELCAAEEQRVARRASMAALAHHRCSLDEYEGDSIKDWRRKFGHTIDIHQADGWIR